VIDPSRTISRKSKILAENSNAATISSAFRYAQSEVTIINPAAIIVAPERGKTVFVQEDGVAFSGLPTPLGGIVAIEHPDGYMTVFSGLDVVAPSISPQIKVGETLGKAMGTGTYMDGNIGLQVFDSVKNFWVNPIQFMSGLIDEVRPQISQLALVSGDLRYNQNHGDKIPLRIPQGRYSIIALIGDSGLSKTRPSGPYGVKVLIDGQENVNRTLSLAVPVKNGLSFLGAVAPSSLFIDDNGRYILSDVFLPRGIHQLDISASDYAGNSSAVRYIIDVY
jgi:hypothetical protein